MVGEDLGGSGRPLGHAARRAVLVGDGLPDTIVIDNGSEFTGRVLDAWANKHGVKLHFIDPGKPVQNAYVESFNGKFRDECLDLHWFTDLADAKEKIESWRIDATGCGRTVRWETRRPRRSQSVLKPNIRRLDSHTSWSKTGAGHIMPVLWIGCHLMIFASAAARIQYA
jgi:transposase InsO family protein